MNYEHLKIILKDTGYSPEQLGARVGMSGMTLRRWSELNPTDRIPDLYEKAFHEVVFELLAEEALPRDSDIVSIVLKESEGGIFNAALKNLGLPKDFSEASAPNSENVVLGISKIGAQSSKQASVEKSKKKILSFSKMGSDWKYRIKILLEVVGSKKLNVLDKWVAYGALFYLITPFDLIPDHIPYFGLLDDFFILGIASVYYANRFPHLFKKP